MVQILVAAQYNDTTARPNHPACRWALPTVVDVILESLGHETRFQPLLLSLSVDLYGIGLRGLIDKLTLRPLCTPITGPATAALQRNPLDS
jgi:hypothetical protein